MLAVKCHHLRALIFRSFLCLPLLQVNNKPFMDLLLQDKQRISKAEWICISEAQQTAHLLHNVVDERSLVHDFPWWQMISCLICASSILFVAETFHSDEDLVENNSPEGRPSAQSLREDAETCLKVFEALSVNSAPARKAANMLGSLSQVRLLANSTFPLPTPYYATLLTHCHCRITRSYTLPSGCSTSAVICSLRTPFNCCQYTGLSSNGSTTRTPLRNIPLRLAE